MVTLDAVAAVALALPEAEEAERRGSRIWLVGGRTFAWERQFSKADVKRFGDEPVPKGPILAIRVADLAEKDAVLAAGHRGFFTIPHFDGYAAVLVELPKATKNVVRDALVDGWLALAPPLLASAYAAEHGLR